MMSVDNPTAVGPGIRSFDPSFFIAFFPKENQQADQTTCHHHHTQRAERLLDPVSED